MATAATTTDVTPATTVIDVRKRLAESADARVGGAVPGHRLEYLSDGADKLLGIKALRGEANKVFGPIIADAHRAHKTAIAQKAKVDDPLAEAEELYKSKMGAYDDDQRRIQREEERRRQEQAERGGRSASAKSKMRKSKARQSTKSKSSRRRRACRSGGRHARRTEGRRHQLRENWKWEVDDKVKLDRFIAANPMYSNLTFVNSSAVTNLVRSLKSATKIPGIKVWPKAILPGEGASHEQPSRNHDSAGR